LVTGFTMAMPLAIAKQFGKKGKPKKGKGNGTKKA
jgi:hypothetical protein